MLNIEELGDRGRLRGKAKNELIEKQTSKKATDETNGVNFCE